VHVFWSPQKYNYLEKPFQTLSEKGGGYKLDKGIQGQWRPQGDNANVIFRGKAPYLSDSRGSSNTSSLCHVQFANALSQII